MSDPIRVGAIGLGLVSRPHLDAYIADPGAELVWVCDASAERTERVAAERGVRGTTDLQEVLADPDVDAVALLLPHQLHHEVGLAALQAGKHVCMEKPITVTEREADDLIAAAREAGRTLAVAENTRYVAAYIAALRLVDEGAIGAVRMLRGFIPDQILDEWADTSDPTQAWKREPGGCGAIMDCAPHMLYLLVWYFGEVETLQAFARGWVPDIPLDNHGIVAGKMASGPLFAMEFCSLTEYPRGERLEIYGTKGSIVIDQVLDPPMVVYAGDQDPHGTPVAGIGYDLAGWKPASIAGTAHDFIAAVRDGREPSVTAADSRYVTSLVQRAYESASRGGVPIDGRDHPTSS